MRKSIPVLLLDLFRKDKLDKIKELNNSQWLSQSEIKETQNRKFLRLIKHCKQNVQYYTTIESLDNVESLDDITKLPFLTKDIIRSNNNALKATNYYVKRFIPNSTSGSTGKTLMFFRDKKDSLINFGILMRNNMWTGWKIGDRQIMLWGSHYDISVAERMTNVIKNRFLHRKLYLSSFDMTEEDMLGYQKKINKYKPRLITAYPSGFFEFASFIEKKGLNIYRPEGIICSGETLYEYQRQKIESVFKSKVYNRYGCREVANIAHQCEALNGLHVNSEHVIVEVIDEHGKPCRPGELGEIVVTDLDNYVFPFVRYKIGDIGVLTDKLCSCGRGLPMMDRVEGRVFDIVVGANGNRITGNFWTILFRTYVKGIRQFQVVQENHKTLDIKLIVDDTYNSDIKEMIFRKIYEKCGEDMTINIHIVDKIPLTESGKHKFVISKVSPFVTNWI